MIDTIPLPVLPRGPGIYILEHTCGDSYIGSSVDVFVRVGQHLSAIHRKNPAGSSQLIIDCAEKNGPEGFTARLLEGGEKSLLKEREQHWIDKLKPTLNVSPVRRPRSEQLVDFTVQLNSSQQYEVERLAEDEYRTVSSTIRMLVDRGLEVVEAENRARANRLEKIENE